MVGRDVVKGIALAASLGLGAAVLFLINLVPEPEASPLALHRASERYASLAFGAATFVCVSLFYCAGYVSRSFRGGGERTPPDAPVKSAPPSAPVEVTDAKDAKDTKDAAVDPSHVMGTDLDELLAQIAAGGKVRSVVVADELGLLVASSGEAALHEPLAVFTSSVGELCVKARGELRLAPVQSLRITDQSGEVLSCQFFPHGAQTLAVTALSTSGRDASADVERALGRLQKIIEQHNNPPLGRP